MHRSALRSTLAVGLGLIISISAHAHYHMLFPDTAAGQREQAVTIRYQWGHPFEHQLFDAQLPESATVFAPDGKKTDLLKSLQKIMVKGEGEKTVAAYQFAFTPDHRGDHTFFLAAAPVWLEEEKLFFHDTVKVVYHVQTQNGWAAATGSAFEIVPLTRPYGLQPGLVFQGQVLAAGKPVGGAMVEVEIYHPTPPKELPPDEQMTRAVKADPNGVFTGTLTDAGWWCVTAERDGGKRERDGKMYPVKQRTTFWVFVDEAPKTGK